MSFIKKGLGKIWKFVKKYWVQILMVAAIVFTAGIATIGIAGFQAAIAANGLMSAVGSTMWAGVTATAGSMGIGAGASGSAAAAATAAGGVGTGAGLGAAMGAGGGFGLGAAGSNLAAATGAEAAAGMVGTAPIVGSAGTGIGVGETATFAMPGVVEGGVAGAAELGVAEAAIVAGAEGAGAANIAADLGAVAAKEGGMTLAKAQLWGSVLTVGGSAISGIAQGKALQDQLDAMKPKAAWGVATEDRGDRTAPVEDYLFEGAVMPPLAGDDPTQAANRLAMQQAEAPLMNVARPMLETQPGRPRGSDQPLMQPTSYLPQLTPDPDDWRIKV